jgi:hypothetical protein
LLKTKDKDISVKELAEETGILIEDILEVFQAFKIIRCQSRDYFFFTEPQYLDELIKRAGDPGHLV